MKKWIFSLLLIGCVFAYDFGTSVESTITFVSANMVLKRGYKDMSLYAISTNVITNNDLVFYAKDMGGFSTMAIYGMHVSTGNGITTINAQACYPNLSLVSGSAQTLTVGTSTTNIQSAFYKFSIPSTASRVVSFNFILR